MKKRIGRGPAGVAPSRLDASSGGEHGRASGGEFPGRRELILAMIRSSATPLSIVDIAEHLDVHPNTVRFHLDGLIDAGRVERALGAITGPGRPPMVFRAHREMDRNGPSNYRLLAKILMSHLAATARDPAIAATELGRTWGASLTDQPLRRAVGTKRDAVTQLVRLLGDLGFEPEPDSGARTKQIRLRHCPFLDLIDDHASVICPLHLGLMQGAMTAISAPVTVSRLDPFVEPDLCLAHVSSRAARSNPRSVSTRRAAP